MNIDSIIAKTSLEPRKYQKTVIAKTLKAYLEEDLNSILIESPTGSGKTLMALVIAKELQDRLNLKIGWLSHRKNLLEQASSKNISKNIGAKIEFISMFEKNPPSVEMLIIDEAQHDACNSAMHIHNTIKPKYILGMTATPFRTDRAKLCFNKIIKDAGIRSLMEQGYLSQYHHYTIKEWNVEALATLYNNDKARWGQSIVFFHTVKDCCKFQDLLDCKSEVVTGSSNREEQILKFRNGEVDVLINCLVLTEGFDMPALRSVFCRPSCKGVTMQMAGRAFRKFPGITHKNIIQCERTKWPFLKTTLPKMQFILKENEWRSIGSNDNVKQASKNVVKSLAKLDVKLPKLLTEKKERVRGRTSMQLRRNSGLSS